MRWACSTCCFGALFQKGQMTISEFLASAAALGLDGVEIAAEHFPSNRPNYAQTLRHQLIEQEVTLAAISYSLTEAEADNLSAASSFLSLAKELGARAFSLMSATDWQLHRTLVVSLTELAERLEIPLGLALPMHPGAAGALGDFLDDINSPYLGVCLPIKTDLHPEDPFWRDFSSLAPFAVHIHLYAFDLTPALLGLPALEMLREAEYEGFVSIKQVPEPTEQTLVELLNQLRSSA